VTDAFICDAVRTPIGRYGGALSGVRADDLAAIPMKALIERNRRRRLERAGRRGAGLRQPGRRGQPQRRAHGGAAGRPADHRLGLDRQPAVRLGPGRLGVAARAIKAGEAQLMIAGGVESMSRAPFVMGKADSAFSRNAEIFDTTLGWRFVNPAMRKAYGVDSMPETAENVADDWKVTRADQDAFALRSQARAAAPRPRAASTPRSSRSLCPSARATRSSSPKTSTRAPRRSRRCRR
jgi:acetyl-CoA acetyltransferase